MLQFVDLKGKSKDELYDMRMTRLDDLLFAYKLIQQGELESELSEQMRKTEREISIIERKLKYYSE